MVLGDFNGDGFPDVAVYESIVGVGCAPFRNIAIFLQGAGGTKTFATKSLLPDRTVHAAALSALAEKADSYRFYFAVYVRQSRWITPFYMGLIDPFRKWIIYPAMLKTIRTTWDQNI